SHARSEPYLPAFFAFGRQIFSGVDARWTHASGVQLRGEFFHGHSFTGVTTNGWYVDGFVHHVGMGPFTAVTRVESMVYTAPAHGSAGGPRRELPGGTIAGGLARGRGARDDAQLAPAGFRRPRRCALGVLPSRRRPRRSRRIPNQTHHRAAAVPLDHDRSGG